MAQFLNRLAGPDDNHAGHLLIATLIWLRTLNGTGELGYANLIRILVPFNNDLYFGANVPSADSRYLPVSDGSVLRVAGTGRHLVWSRNWRTELNLGYAQIISDQTKVHMSWIEWALGTAIIKLWEAGINWVPKPKAETIGGLEVADFSDL